MTPVGGPPNAVEAARLVALARPYHDARAWGKAEDCYRAALQADPFCTDAMHGLAQLVQQLDRGDEVVRWMEMALRLKPSISDYHYTLAVGQMMNLDVEGAVASNRRAVTLRPDNLPAFQNMVFCSDLLQSTTPEYALALRREFNARFCAERTSNALPHRNRPDPDKRLRVGFVGADFRGHSAAMASKPIIFGLDRERFEVYLYSNGKERDAESDQMEVAANWRDIVDLDPGAQAQEIADDRIDVLFDLAGFTAGSALQCLSLRPAPVQISAWGYITGTGLDCIDVMFGDPTITPPEHDRYYHEAVMRLPAPFTYIPAAQPALPTATPRERNGYTTYGYYGRPNKISYATLDLWAAILRADMSSRLILKAGTYQQTTPTRRVMNALVARGVAPERVMLVDATNRPEHLAAHNEIDIALDPTPQTGGMTSCDAFLMGVPVVTLLGRRAPERITAGIWQACGREDGIAATVDEYVSLALKPPPPAAYRPLLRDAFLQSPICQHRVYVQAVEAAIRACWAAWCARANDVQEAA